MSRFPRTLVITSCSDLKTQPKVATDTRALQNTVRDTLKKIHALEVRYRDIISKLEKLRRKKNAQDEARALRAEADKVEEQLHPLRAEVVRLRADLGQYMLLQEDFTEPKRLAERERTFADFMCPAAEMYAGPHHENVMRGIKTLRERFGDDSVDLKIISAGYGLLDEDTIIAPYDVTFTGMDGSALDDWAGLLGIHRELEKAIVPYDLVIFLLGKEYLRSVHLPIAYEQKRQKLVFVASASSLPFVNYNEDYGMVMVGNSEIHDFGAAAVALKGKLFRLFGEAVAKNGWSVMEQLHKRPNIFLETISKARKSVAATTVPRRTQPDEATAVLMAHNQAFPMTFFMPENEDQVQPNCDPWALVQESREAVADKQSVDGYVYEDGVLAEAPFDGILVSLHEISTWSEAKRKRIFEVGARQYLRYYQPGPILGDCGAFTFNDHGEPPFTSEKILEQYRQLGLDMGVSVDYIIFPDLWRSNRPEAERRFAKNLEEARRFWEAWQRTHARYPDWRFTPIGVAQGGTPEKFAEAVKALQDMGYRYLALGGLARSPASLIESCLKEVAPTLLPDTQLHLFGFAKLELAARFRELGVTSFDSTSPLVQGFIRGVYWDPRPERYGTQYTAIRVPISDGRTAAQKSGQTGLDAEESRRLEAAVLSALRMYDADSSAENYAAARDALVAYSQFLQPWPYDEHFWESMKTLRERPWDHCTCKICREWKIAVAILRSNNHNRRRGFHNTGVFYRQKKAWVGPGMKLDTELER